MDGLLLYKSPWSKMCELFTALGSLVVGLQQRLDLIFSRQVVHKGDAVIPVDQDVVGYRSAWDRDRSVGRSRPCRGQWGTRNHAG